MDHICDACGRPYTSDAETPPRRCRHCQHAEDVRVKTIALAKGADRMSDGSESAAEAEGGDHSAQGSVPGL